MSPETPLCGSSLDWMDPGPSADRGSRGPAGEDERRHRSPDTRRGTPTAHRAPDVVGIPGDSPTGEQGRPPPRVLVPDGSRSGGRQRGLGGPAAKPLTSKLATRVRFPSPARPLTSGFRRAGSRGADRLASASRSTTTDGFTATDRWRSDERSRCHALRNASRSALIVSACVVGMPCGKPS
jgi:hypothetical protein